MVEKGLLTFTGLRWSSPDTRVQFQAPGKREEQTGPAGTAPKTTTKAVFSGIARPPTKQKHLLLK